VTDFGLAVSTSIGVLLKHDDYAHAAPATFGVERILANVSDDLFLQCFLWRNDKGASGVAWARATVDDSKHSKAGTKLGGPQAAVSLGQMLTIKQIHRR